MDGGMGDVLPVRTAGAQRLLITYHQALDSGMTPSAISRRIASGAWQRLFPRVYWVGRGEPPWETRALALVLWGGRGCALSHETAAALWKLEGFRPSQFVLTTPRSARSPGPDVRIHRAALTPRDVSTLDGIAVTSVARTVLDLSAGHPDAVVEAALDEVLCRKLVTPAQLRWFVRSLGPKGPAGTKRLRRLLSRREPSAASESALERRVWRLLVQSGLPAPVAQHVVRDGSDFVARVDFAYPAHRVAIEVDGYRWHSGRAAWARDLRRRNRLTELGWLVLHVTHADLTERPDEIVKRIRRVLS